MAEKTSMIFYHNWLDLFDELTAEEVGLLTLALLKYDATGEGPEFSDRTLRTLFKGLKATIDRNREAYEERCEKNRENVNKRWHKGDTTVYDRIRPNTNHTDNDKDNDNEYKNDKESDWMSDSDVIPLSDSLPAILSSWNSISHVKQIRGFPSDRLKRLAAMSVSEILEGIEKVRNSAYLQKKGNIKFDNYINPNVLPKLLEGNYDDDYSAKEESDGFDFDC